MTRVGIRERKKADTRIRILESAVALFGEHGIDAVTVEEIAEAAGVGKGTVYNYFGAKDDIVVAFLVELDRRTLDRIALLPAPEMTAAEALDAAAWTLLEDKPPYHAFVRAFLARLFQGDGFVFELAAFQTLQDAALTALFDRLLARHGMRPTVSVPDLILSFKTMALGVTAVWSFEGPPYANARALMRRHMFLLAKEMES